MVKKIKRKVNGKLLIYALAISLSPPSLSETGGERVDGVGCWLVSVYQLSTSFVCRHQFFIFLEQQQSKNSRRWFIDVSPSGTVPLFAATTVLRYSKV